MVTDNNEALGLDDEALISSILNEGDADGGEPVGNNEPAAVTPAPKPEPVAQGGESPSVPVQPVAPVAQEAPAGEPKQPGQVEQPRNVPVSELQAERRKRQDVERREAAALARLAEFERAQPQKPAPELWEAPDQFVDHRVNQTVAPVLSAVEEIKHHYSEERAIEKHGADTVQAALSAIQNA